MRILKWYAPTDQQEITDIALHYVFEAEPGAKEYTIFASENPDFVKAETVHVLQKDVLRTQRSRRLCRTHAMPAG